MRRSRIFTAVLASCVAVVCTGWTQKPEANTDEKSVSLTGTISQDGKTFTNEADHKTWDITNPNKSKGQEGNRVLVGDSQFRQEGDLSH